MEKFDKSGEILFRQRRFLIFASLVVTGYYVLGVRLRSAGQFQGFPFDISRPDVAIVGIWVIWSWALWRYAQRLFVLWDQQKTYILRDVDFEETRIALAIAQARARRHVSKGEVDEHRRPNMRLVGQVVIPRSMAQILDPPADKAPMHQLDFVETNGVRTYRAIHAGYSWHSTDTNGGSSSFSIPFQLNGRELLILKVRAWVNALVRRPAFSEDIAPLFIALLALLSPLARFL